MPNKSGIKTLLVLAILCTGCRAEEMPPTTNNEIIDEPLILQQDTSGPIPVFIEYNTTGLAPANSEHNNSLASSGGHVGCGMTSPCSPYVIEDTRWVQCEQKGYTIQVDIRLKTPKEFCDYCDCIMNRPCCCCDGSGCPCCTGKKQEGAIETSGKNTTKTSIGSTSNSSSVLLVNPPLASELLETHSDLTDEDIPVEEIHEVTDEDIPVEESHEVTGVDPQTLKLEEHPPEINPELLSEPFSQTSNEPHSVTLSESSTEVSSEPLPGLSSDHSSGTPYESSNETPYDPEFPSETSPENVNEPPLVLYSEHPSENLSNISSEPHTDHPSETSSEISSNSPSETSSEISSNSPSKTPSETSSEIPSYPSSESSLESTSKTPDNDDNLVFKSANPTDNINQETNEHEDDTCDYEDCEDIHHIDDGYYGEPMSMVYHPVAYQPTYSHPMVVYPHY